MSNFCVLTGFENIVLMIELDRQSLACTETKHRPRIQSNFITLEDIRDCDKAYFTHAKYNGGWVPFFHE